MVSCVAIHDHCNRNSNEIIKKNHFIIMIMLRRVMIMIVMMMMIYSTGHDKTPVRLPGQVSSCAGQAGFPGNLPAGQVKLSLRLT